MTRTWALRALALLAVMGFTMGAASADNGPTVFSARLNGFQEAPGVLTNGTATFIAVVRDDTLAYRLTFSGLSSNAVVSHIHFGQRATNGTPFVWLCGAVPAGLPAAPACPAATSGTVTGTLTAANVAGVPAQGIPAGDFQALVRILRSGSAYANIHTTTFGGGEVRGQIHFGITDDD